ncbi:hypothetical protein BDZ89DRAFT_46472 [Hymenopellis radicata]|nr:hypothetical protein BDZ89DRAFT_46472 [Hymenopellis radicata]
MLKQSQIARYLDQCTDDDGVDEVLSAYVLSKMINGLNCAQVLYKLHLLCCYLQVTNRAHILRLGQDGFKASALKSLLEGSASGGVQASSHRHTLLPTDAFKLYAYAAVTKAGIAVWNELRRNKKFRLQHSMTDRPTAAQDASPTSSRVPRRRSSGAR